ncbi:MAG TPA: tetratricopeptide repeat-containing sensor histidine kinase, partial [Mucilaginibacter sp.]
MNKRGYQQKLIFITAAVIQLICVSSTYVTAQNKIIDSLVKLLPATKADTTRVILLNKIAFALYSTDYQKSLDYCEQANSLALKLNYVKGLALNCHIQGVVYTFKDDYATALIKEQQAASLALKINDFALLAKAYNAAGLAYSRLNDSVRSLAAFNDAIEALKRTPDKSYHAAILHNVAVLYVEKKQYDRGLKDLFAAAELNLHNNNNQWLVQNYFWIGKTYYLQKQYQLAIKYESLAISIAEQYHFYQPLVKSLGVMGATNMALKKYSLAESQLLQAEKIAYEKKIASEQLAILHSLADLYEQEHNLKMALAYQKKYHDVYESVFNSAKTKLVAEYQARFQDRQKYIENQLLKKDRAISKANIEQRNLLLLITLLTILVLIVSTIVIYLAYYKIKQKNRQTEYQHKKIAMQNLQLENLNQLKDKLFSVLAHDLRGPLAALKQLLEFHDQHIIDNEEEEMMRKSIMLEVDQNSELINNLLIWGRSQLNGFIISPKAFAVYELASQIISQLKTEIDRKKIVVINNVNPDIITFADKEMIDNVVRNLLINAIKFTSEKGTIEIAATVKNNEVLVSVVDTGIGMTPEQAARLFKGDFYTTKTALNPHGVGLGLQICKEFVEQNNGKIWVESKKGQG